VTLKNVSVSLKLKLSKNSDLIPSTKLFISFFNTREILKKIKVSNFLAIEINLIEKSCQFNVSSASAWEQVLNYALNKWETCYFIQFNYMPLLGGYSSSMTYQGSWYSQNFLLISYFVSEWSVTF
jgi:hypothetical protein